MPKNKPPTAVYLSSTHVDENAPGAVIGTLTASDKNLKHGDVITYTVDDSRFEVIEHDGQSTLQLKSGVALDYEASPTVTLEVTATDKGGLSKTKAFTLSVQDLPEAPTTERISISSTGEQANGDSISPSISADARYVAYESYASNLVSDDTNNAADVFVFDHKTHTTERISVGLTGEQGNSDSGQPSISADGRYVAYQGWASNLVEGDSNDAVDVFVFDRQTQTTERVSISSTGEQANGASMNASISADGRYVTFTSAASNLVQGDTNGVDDVFVFDRQTHTTERVSVSSNGLQANGSSDHPSISGDGRYVAFESLASNLGSDDPFGGPDIFVYDRETHTTERVSPDTPPGASDPVISADGRYVAFVKFFAIYTYDRETGTAERTPVSGDSEYGGPREPSISADGRYVAALNSPGNFPSPFFQHIYVYDQQTGSVAQVSNSSEITDPNVRDGTQSSHPSISADGHTVAYQSNASDLVSGDTNGFTDIFVAHIDDIFV
ncbi:cadherin domain-containing protein [Microvirga yunnanensis]|uniref:cadherin domain-containing protein n=1 Tax=Microvirga yunnanensis TaxID=2953740 RepID=UPI0021C76508|nr:cadherin domain-containing protein [Microvirga sp. HBU65207]